MTHLFSNAVCNYVQLMLMETNWILTALQIDSAQVAFLALAVRPTVHWPK